MAYTVAKRKYNIKTARVKDNFALGYTDTLPAPLGEWDWQNRQIKAVLTVRGLPAKGLMDIVKKGMEDMEAATGKTERKFFIPEGDFPNLTGRHKSIEDKTVSEAYGSLNYGYNRTKLSGDTTLKLGAKLTKDGVVYTVTGLASDVSAVEKVLASMAENGRELTLF